MKVPYPKFRKAFRLVSKEFPAVNAEPVIYLDQIASSLSGSAPQARLVSALAHNVMNMACKAWLDQGRKHYPLALSCIRLSLEHIRGKCFTAKSFESLARSSGLDCTESDIISSSKRYKELNDIIIQCAKQLPFFGDLNPKKMVVLLDNIVEYDQKEMFKYNRPSDETSVTTLNPMLPPSFIKNALVRADTTDRIDRAKKRIIESTSFESQSGRSNNTHEPLDTKDKIVQELLERGRSEADILNYRFKRNSKRMTAGGVEMTI
jgi:hypothetical protein